MKSVDIPREGLTLVGEAAMEYVKYKYFATIFDGAIVIFFICFFGVCVYLGLKKLASCIRQ